MKIVRNIGTERVIDLVRPWLVQGNQLEEAQLPSRWFDVQ
jgi:hypothetical protein